MANRITFVFAFLLLLSSDGFAQQINSNPIFIKTGAIEFNPEVIQKNKIKNICINILDKPDGSVIVNKGSQNYYEFNTSGYLIKHHYTIFNKAIIDNSSDYRKYINDTINIELKYDSMNRLINKKINIDGIVELYEMNYNEFNQINSETKTRVTIITSGNDSMKEMKTIVFSDKYNYIKVSSHQTQIKISSESNDPYKKIILNYDSVNNLKSYYLEHIYGKLNETYSYIYDKKGRVIKKTYSTSKKDSAKEESVYEYNGTGDLTSKKSYSNGVLFYETSYLFDQKTGLIKSEVSRDHKKQHIIIAKYEYSYYP